MVPSNDLPTWPWSSCRQRHPGRASQDRGWGWLSSSRVLEPRRRRGPASRDCSVLPFQHVRSVVRIGATSWLPGWTRLFVGLASLKATRSIVAGETRRSSFRLAVGAAPAQRQVEAAWRGASDQVVRLPMVLCSVFGVETFGSQAFATSDHTRGFTHTAVKTGKSRSRPTKQNVDSHGLGLRVLQPLASRRV